mmetsp:Transcript_8979/g.21845  ORF Transcript_8979/g.21845 Transcript_8979/m.21845 type:complete len:347 (-) Transcript_8979:694-1734(-)
MEPSPVRLFETPQIPPKSSMMIRLLSKEILLLLQTLVAHHLFRLPSSRVRILAISHARPDVHVGLFRQVHVRMLYAAFLALDRRRRLLMLLRVTRRMFGLVTAVRVHGGGPAVIVMVILPSHGAGGEGGGGGWIAPAPSTSRITPAIVKVLVGIYGVYAPPTIVVVVVLFGKRSDVIRLAERVREVRSLLLRLLDDARDVVVVVVRLTSIVPVELGLLPPLETLQPPRLELLSPPFSHAKLLPNVAVGRVDGGYRRGVIVRVASYGCSGHVRGQTLLVVGGVCFPLSGGDGDRQVSLLVWVCISMIGPSVPRFREGLGFGSWGALVLVIRSPDRGAAVLLGFSPRR